MLNIEVDVFSGRTNPTWSINGIRAEELLLRIAREQDAIAPLKRGFNGLGFRELQFRQSAAESRDNGLPRHFALASSACKDFELSSEIARTVIEQMPAELVGRKDFPQTVSGADLKEIVLERLWRAHKGRLRSTLDLRPTRSVDGVSSTADPDCEKCHFEVSNFNPTFWNSALVQPLNNCYNYATSHRTNTFAQPGRAHSAEAASCTLQDVKAAAMADGLVPRCHCLPVSQSPRWLVALVIDPGVDFHWLRLHREGFWGHKPGQTAAINVDNANNTIFDPASCDLNGYQFGEYFYSGKLVTII